MTERQLTPETLDARDERGLLLKLDAFFVPIIMVVYLTCFLDRTNIGNVKVAGMPRDIGTSPQQFSTAVSIFYTTYVVFEPPWTIMMKRMTPRLMLTLLCVVWSVATIFTGFVTNIAGLYVVRLVLGACEAGLFPALNVYLTMVYKREEQAVRVSYLFVCTAIAGAFGGTASVLHPQDGRRCRLRWLEMGLHHPRHSLLAHRPHHLEDDESARLAASSVYGLSEEFDWREIRFGLQDPKLYLSATIPFCQDVLLYGFSTFLPSIIVSMGYSALQAQYLSIPVYILGGVTFVAVAFLSDHFCIRGLFLFLTNIPSIAGYMLIICPTSNRIKFLGTFLCAVAAYSGPGLNLTWLNVNVAPHYRRATAIGVQLSIGNSAGIVVGQIYRTAPYKKLGNVFSVAALGLSQLVIVLKWLYLRHCNEEKRKMLNGEKEDARKVKTGDKENHFHYHL